MPSTLIVNGPASAITVPIPKTVKDEENSQSDGKSLSQLKDNSIHQKYKEMLLFKNPTNANIKSTVNLK